MLAMLAAATAAAPAQAQYQAQAPLELGIDSSAYNPELPYEGLGALSAGADAALLFDYTPAVYHRILDLLFLPGLPGGAGLQILKVEIPGDVQSTCGSGA
jgi:hypothetical protein